MTGWILFAGLAGFLIGAIAGIGISAWSVSEMVKNGDIIYVEKKESEK